jgi:hypothetical protein
MPNEHPHSVRAHKAWKTRRQRKAVQAAQQTAKASQRALKEAAEEEGYYCVFLDSKKGNPRTGIVDAVLVKVLVSDADKLEIRLVQLKGGSAGLTSLERKRLRDSCKAVTILPTYAFWHSSAEVCDLEPPLQS